MQIELTDDECDALWAVIFGTIGGVTNGPRKHFESIAAKLGENVNRRRFVARIEKVGKAEWGNQAVVVREAETGEE
jgi:hypothetical protein